MIKHWENFQYKDTKTFTRSTSFLYFLYGSKIPTMNEHDKKEHDFQSQICRAKVLCNLLSH